MLHSSQAQPRMRAKPEAGLLAQVAARLVARLAARLAVGAAGTAATLLLAGSLMAEATAVLPPPARPMTEVEQAAWPAIGQISYGGPAGRAICTGTLVAPDLVLTAGHCVAVDGVAMQPGDVQFAAQWRDGRSPAIRHGKAVVLAKPTPGQDRVMSQDVALLVLDAPIDAAVARPLPLSRQDLFAERYALISYRRDAPRIVWRNEGCDLAGTKPAILKLSCTAVSGNSGAPVLMQRQGEWKIAGIMVAAAQGEGGVWSLAVIPGDDLRAVIAEH